MNYPHTIVPGLLGVAQEYPITVTFSLVDHVYALALNRARACALGSDFAEDTSQSFGTHWLSDLRENKMWAKRCLESEAYLKACAENFVEHAASAVQRQHYRETGLPSNGDVDELDNLEFRRRSESGITDPALRKELRSLLIEAVDRLSARPHEIFIRRHVNKESVASIAEALGCTRNAVSVSLSASRSQIAKYLVQAGHPEADIREYLYEILRPE